MRLAAWLLAPIAPLLGWGPLTHCYLNHRARETFLKEDPPADHPVAALLHDERRGREYIQHAVSPDLITAYHFIYRSKAWAYAHNPLPNTMNSNNRVNTRRNNGELATYRAPVRTAVVTCSVPSGRWSDGLFHRASTISTPRNDTVLNANVASDPASAISNPPSAGPMARPTFMLTPLSNAACGISSRDTSSG